MKSTRVSGLTTSSVSRGRLITFSVLALILALIASADFVSHAADFVAPHRIHVIGHEIVSAWIIVAAASQLRASWRRIAGVQQLFVIFIGALLADALSNRFSGLGVLLIFAIALGALHPERKNLFKPGKRMSPLLVSIAILGAIPLLTFAESEFTKQRLLIEPIHADLGHWEWMATLAMLIVLLAVLTAVKTPGWRLPAWSTGLGAFVFGLASVIFTGEVGKLRVVVLPGVWSPFAAGWSSSR